MAPLAAKKSTPLNAALAELLKTIHEEGPTRRQPRRVPVPPLPRRGKLRPEDQWKSLLWSIDSAQEHGRSALRGVALALARAIQGRTIEAMLLDARMPVRETMAIDELLWDLDVVLNAEGQTLKSLPRKMRRGKAVSMEHAAVFPLPWERFRLFRAIGNIGDGLPEGPWRQDPNHFGIEWRPWSILWVTNGNHSTMAGLIRRGGLFRPYETYSFEPVLRAVHTDGLRWYRRDTGESIAAVQSILMAGIFVVGQRLVGMPRATPAGDT